MTATSHSKKRVRLIWALSAALVILILAIVSIQWHSTAHAPAQRHSDDVTRITIERPNAETIELQLRESWHITAPIEMAANEQRVLPLLMLYTNPDPGYDINTVDLNASGLTTPQATLHFNDHTVSIGDVSLEGGQRYAQHNNRVTFVPDWVLPLVQGGISAIADLTVWGSELEALTVNDKPLNSDDITKAQSLSAQQLVLWPREDAPIELATHSVQSQSNGKFADWTVTVTARYIAIQAQNSRYAYIVSVEELPWLPSTQP